MKAVLPAFPIYTPWLLFCMYVLIPKLGTAVMQIRAKLPPGVDGWGYSLKGMMGMVVIGGLLVTASYFYLNRTVVKRLTASQPKKKKVGCSLSIHLHVIVHVRGSFFQLTSRGVLQCPLLDSRFLCIGYGNGQSLLCCGHHMWCNVLASDRLLIIYQCLAWSRSLCLSMLVP